MFKNIVFSQNLNFDEKINIVSTLLANSLFEKTCNENILSLVRKKYEKIIFGESKNNEIFKNIFFDIKTGNEIRALHNLEENFFEDKWIIFDLMIDVKFNEQNFVFNINNDSIIFLLISHILKIVENPNVVVMNNIKNILYYNNFFNIIKNNIEQPIIKKINHILYFDLNYNCFWMFYSFYDKKLENHILRGIEFGKKYKRYFLKKIYYSEDFFVLYNIDTGSSCVFSVLEEKMYVTKGDFFIINNLQYLKNHDFDQDHNTIYFLPHSQKNKQEEKNVLSIIKKDICNLNWEEIANIEFSDLSLQIKEKTLIYINLSNFNNKQLAQLANLIKKLFATNKSIFLLSCPVFLINTVFFKNIYFAGMVSFCSVSISSLKDTKSFNDAYYSLFKYNYRNLKHNIFHNLFIHNIVVEIKFNKLKILESVKILLFLKNNRFSVLLTNLKNNNYFICSLLFEKEDSSNNKYMFQHFDISLPIFSFYNNNIVDENQIKFLENKSIIVNNI